MKYTRVLLSLLVVAVGAVSGAGQRPELTISLNEPFFDSLLDAVFENAAPIEFSMASRENAPRADRGSGTFSFAPGATDECRQTIQIRRENNGVRTAVRFREGRILAPLAFTGSYKAPLIGCVSFAGYAETTIDLEFDRPNQRLIARARVLNVSMDGTGGVGGSVIAKLVQGSIDRKINPIEVITLDKASFLLPVRKDINLRMKATSARYEVVNGAVNVMIAYDFLKA